MSQMINNAIHSAMQSLAPNFEQLRTEIQQVRTSSVPVEMEPSIESRRQDILNESLRESQTTLKQVLQTKYSNNNIPITEAQLDSIISEKVGGAGKEIVQKMRVDDLPKFDGRDVFGYLVSVTSAIVQFGQQPVARTIPRTFEGQARNWWNVLTDETKLQYMSNVYRFKDALEEEFSDSVGVAKDKAKNRIWKIGSEDIMTYYYEKLDLMVAANHGNNSDVEVCYEVREGLPIEFRPYIRTVLERNPSTSRLRKELQSLENDFVKMYRSSHQRQRIQTPSMSPSSSSISPPMSSSPESARSSSPVYRRSRTEPPLRESYDPKRVGQQSGPDGKMMRSYTLPNGQVILLNRTCRVNNCNGNHFDFEHDHLSSKKRAQSVPATDMGSDTYEGYPISMVPSVEEESSSDEDQGMKLLSYPMSDMGSEDNHYMLAGESRYFAKRRGPKN